MIPLLIMTLVSGPAPALVDTLPLRPNKYMVSINKKTPDFYFGSLQNLTDSTIDLTKKFYTYGTARADKSFAYGEIDRMYLYRGGSKGMGALIGGLGGALVGGVIGAISYTPCPNCFFQFDQSFDITIGAFLGLFLGFGVGLIFAGRKKHFNINRSKENFSAMRNTLLQRYGKGQANE